MKVIMGNSCSVFPYSNYTEKQNAFVKIGSKATEYKTLLILLLVFTLKLSPLKCFSRPVLRFPIYRILLCGEKFVHRSEVNIISYQFIGSCMNFFFSFLKSLRHLSKSKTFHMGSLTRSNSEADYVH